MIEIRDLSKTFTGKISVKAVDRLSLDISIGVTGLVGHNGAGKSTLFRLMADVLSHDKGTILYDGIPYDDPALKKRVFFLCDNPITSNGDSPKDVYELYNTFFDIDKNRYEGLLDKLSLPKKRRIGGFSKGMRRQLFLALALSVDADYYLLDEAFDGIDPLSLEIIKEEISRLGALGKTLVLSSHNINSLERLAERFIILYQGHLAKEGERGDMGVELSKFQLITDKEVDEETLRNLGIEVISFKRIGSICHIVVKSGVDDKTKLETLSPTLLEQIALDQDEVITMQMLLAKKEADDDR